MMLLQSQRWGKVENPDSIERFWDRFVGIVRNHNVKEPFDRWYVIRAEEYIKFYPGKRLQRRTGRGQVFA